MVGEPLALHIIAAFVCLGQKYDIPTLNHEARKRIYRLFPITLEEHDASNKWGDIDLSVDERRGRHSYFDLLIIARRAGLLSILPLLLYYCCEDYPPSSIKNGFQLTALKKACFPLEDQVALLAGYPTISTAQFKTTYIWTIPSVAPSTCTSPEECRFTRQEYFKKRFIFNTRIQKKSRFGALQDWNTATAGWQVKFCNHCTEVSRRAHEYGRREFWNMLPSLFDLPSWEELSKERDDMCVFSLFI